MVVENGIVGCSVSPFAIGQNFNVSDGNTSHSVLVICFNFVLVLGNTIYILYVFHFNFKIDYIYPDSKHHLYIYQILYKNISKI